MTDRLSLEVWEVMGMRDGHAVRWGGAAGIGAVVLGIIGTLVLGGTPKITGSTGEIASFLVDHRGRIITAALLFALAVALFLWFGAALATAFRRADDTSEAPAVVLAGFTLVSAIGFVAVSMFAGITSTMTAHRNLLMFAAGPYTAMTVMGTIAGIALALALAASAVAIARTGVFPRWMAWFTGLVALVRLLAALTAGASGGVFMPGGWLTAVVPGLLTGLWVLAASALLIRGNP